MTDSQRLERIESLLECLLKVAKMQADIQIADSHNADLDDEEELNQIKPIEHPKSAPRSEMDEALSEIVRENREDRRK